MLLNGLVKHLAQIGASVAVDVAGYTLLAKTRSRC
jgi:hypothetical protein